MKLSVWILLIHWNAEIQPITLRLHRGRMLAGSAHHSDTNQHSKKNGQSHGMV
jgi:hypothetical protein